MVVCPSDHIIFDEKSFSEHLKTALDAASKDNRLITLGITPTRPDTGYGYIQYFDKEKPEKDARIRKVKTFTEKPQLKLLMNLLKVAIFYGIAAFLFGQQKQ